MLTMSSAAEELLLLTLLLRKRRKQRRRLLWTHPITSARLTEGAHYLLMQDLQDDSSKHLNYFRMSSQTFNELLSHLQDSLQKQDTNMRRSIPPQERLAMTLR